MAIPVQLSLACLSSSSLQSTLTCDLLSCHQEFYQLDANGDELITRWEITGTQCFPYPGIDGGDALWDDLDDDSDGFIKFSEWSAGCFYYYYNGE